MRVFRLWLKKDNDVPRFQRLALKVEEVPLSRILKEGIHPVGHTRNIYGSECSHILDKLSQVLNDRALHIAEIAEFDFCSEVHLRMPYDRQADEDAVRDILETIQEAVYFVEGLDFQELTEIAKARIAKIWNHHVAKGLLMKTQRDFNGIRDFLKSKNKALKLSGYKDLEHYPLHEILSPQDFQEDERAIITSALPIHNFRKPGFLEKISTSDGYLSLVPKITHFQLVRAEAGEFTPNNLVYNCERQSDQFVMMPDIEGKEERRPLARQIASKWGEGSGRYCFSVGIGYLDQMLGTGDFGILFPSLTYRNDMSKHSSIRLKGEEIPKYSIGKHVSSRSTGNEIREVFRAFDISQAGRKEDLLKRLIRHVAEVYNLKRFELDEYFSKRRFIYIPHGCRDAKDGFEVLAGCPIRPLLLAMYAVQHMRGNAILEASHENDAYDVKDLARAVINRDVRVPGTFIKVEDRREE